MKLHFLGTGSAMVKQHLHASFVVEDDTFRLLVDTMGGYDIVRALRASDIPLPSLRALFVSHRHTDHALGFPWIARIIWRAARDGKLPEGYVLDVLCSLALRDILIRGTDAFIPDYWAIAKKYIRFHDLAEGTEVALGSGVTLTAMDLRSDKAEQFGFHLRTPTGTLAFCGDEPLREWHHDLVRGCDALIHDCFCLEADEGHYKALQKMHATAVIAARNAASVGAKTLILSHIADEKPDRAARFRKEAAREFPGTIHVPEDGSTIAL